MKTLKKCSIILFVLALVIPALALGTASAQGSVEVVYWSMWNEDEAQGQVIKQAVSDFEAANPSIKVRVVWNGRENRNLVGPAIEAGETIDVFDTGMDLIISNLAQYIIPLDEVHAQMWCSSGDGMSRMRSRSKLARPYICRLSNFKR
jgi:raffinose/stachyose/melibiose transport system substrate-binding protein